MDEGDSYTVAKGKVKDVSKAIRDISPSAKFDFMLGETEFLIDAINDIDETTYSHVTQAKKDLITSILNPSE